MLRSAIRSARISPTVPLTCSCRRSLSVTINADKTGSEAATPSERFRRAIFYVPGSDERKLRSSTKRVVDTVVFDLEDSVPFNRKGAARQLVFDALEGYDLGRAEKTVRINHVGSGLEVDDLSVVVGIDMDRGLEMLKGQQNL
ncbi:hypothetical protein HDV00_009290 [Rhizophlyctis rosea]|nr:hypothetical protein HDV00_009290 [Rhizophlyctis rosea]